MRPESKATSHFARAMNYLGFYFITYLFCNAAIVAKLDRGIVSRESWLADYRKLFGPPGEKLEKSEIAASIKRLSAHASKLSDTARSVLTNELEHVKALVETSRLEPDKCRLDRMIINEINELISQLSEYKTNVIPYLMYQKDIHFDLCSYMIGDAIMSTVTICLSKSDKESITRLMDCIARPPRNLLTLIDDVSRARARDFTGNIIIYLEQQHGNLNDINANFQQAFESELLSPCKRLSQKADKFAKFWSLLQAADRHFLKRVDREVLFWTASTIVCGKIVNDSEFILRESLTVLYRQTPERSFTTMLIHLFSRSG